MFALNYKELARIHHFKNHCYFISLRRRIFVLIPRRPAMPFAGKNNYWARYKVSLLGEASDERIGIEADAIFRKSL